MIPKAQLLDIAMQEALQPTTVEKDYVLGWLLHAIARHGKLSRWAFKGGTCLKKCFFETYRFSEDLDFTVPVDESLDQAAVITALVELGEWVEGVAGIVFPKDGIEAEEYLNKRGKRSIQAKMTYAGPLNLKRRQLQRVKLDLTQDEVIADELKPRQIFHPYPDDPQHSLTMACYSVDEILAEKTRALYERQGRARDIYDIVHLSRTLRTSIDPAKARRIIGAKFAFKELPVPDVTMILARVDRDVVRANWAAQLGHQLPAVPSVEVFLSELEDALAWWLEPQKAASSLQAAPAQSTDLPVPRQDFPTVVWTTERAPARAVLAWYGSTAMGNVVCAARNRRLAVLSYDGVQRLVEPYSLRIPRTGNLLLYVYEVERGGLPGEGVKALEVAKIQSAIVSDQSFSPRYVVEL